MHRIVIQLTPGLVFVCDTAMMEASVPERPVKSDDYQTTSEDVIFTADLHSSLVVCLYDEVEEDGALLHLRLAAPGQSLDPNLTDNTLSSDLALLDRAVRELSSVSPRAQHWRAKLVAQTENQAAARVRCDGLQSFIGAFLQDARIRLVSSVAHVESPVSVRFRPAMGQLRTLTGTLS